MIDKSMKIEGDKREEKRVGVRGKRAYELWQKLIKCLGAEVVPEDRAQVVTQQIQNYFKSAGYDDGVKLAEKVLEKGESTNVADFDKVRALIHLYWFREEDALAHQAHSQDTLPSITVTLYSASVLSSRPNTDRIDY